MAYLIAGGATMPCPVAITVGHEIIWSSNSGRSSSGKMIGDVVAEKRTLSVEWGILTDSEMEKIKKHMVAGFFPIEFHDFGGNATIQFYRGTLSGELIGELSDGITYWRRASVQVVQQ